MVYFVFKLIFILCGFVNSLSFLNVPSASGFDFYSEELSSEHCSLSDAEEDEDLSISPIRSQTNKAVNEVAMNRLSSSQIGENRLKISCECEKLSKMLSEINFQTNWEFASNCQKRKVKAFFKGIKDIAKEIQKSPIKISLFPDLRIFVSSWRDIVWGDDNAIVNRALFTLPMFHENEDSLAEAILSILEYAPRMQQISDQEIPEICRTLCDLMININWNPSNCQKQENVEKFRGELLKIIRFITDSIGREDLNLVYLPEEIATFVDAWRKMFYSDDDSLLSYMRHTFFPFDNPYWCPVDDVVKGLLEMVPYQDNESLHEVCERLARTIPLIDWNVDLVVANHEQKKIIAVYREDFAKITRFIKGLENPDSPPEEIKKLISLLLETAWGDDSLLFHLLNTVFFGSTARDGEIWHEPIKNILGVNSPFDVNFKDGIVETCENLKLLISRIDWSVPNSAGNSDVIEFRKQLTEVFYFTGEIENQDVPEVIKQLINFWRENAWGDDELILESMKRVFFGMDKFDKSSPFSEMVCENVKTILSLVPICDDTLEIEIPETCEKLTTLILSIDFSANRQEAQEFQKSAINQFRQNFSKIVRFMKANRFNTEKNIRELINGWRSIRPENSSIPDEIRRVSLNLRDPMGDSLMRIIKFVLDQIPLEKPPILQIDDPRVYNDPRAGASSEAFIIKKRFHPYKY